MRRSLTLAGAAVTLAAGLSAAVALGAGTGSHDTSTSLATGGATTTTKSPPAKVFVCHHTGSSKHPYHLIHISTDALAAHMRHGDITPGSGNSCPTTQPAGVKAHGHDQQGKDAESSGKDDDATETTETETETDD